MEFSVARVVDVAVVLIIARSITNVVHQLPNCGARTRAAIDRTIIELGCFLHLKENVEILKYKIDALTRRVQEVNGRTQLVQKMLVMREESQQLCHEAGHIISDHWYRRWGTTCYRMSIRVTEKIIDINCSLDREGERLEQPTRDAIPGIVVVILIAYTLINAVLQLPNSSTSTSDAIDWIVLDMSCAFKVKDNIKSLRDIIDRVRRKIDEVKADEEKNKITSVQAWLREEVALVEKGVQLCDEAERMISHWHKGWTCSRYRLGKRIEAHIMMFEIGRRVVPHPRGRKARDVISKIDAVTYILPAAISDIRHYLHFNANIQTLHHKIAELQRLRDSLVKNLNTYRFQNQEEAEKRVKLLEAAKVEGVQLIQEAELMKQYCYKRKPGSLYRLSKRLVKVIANINVLTDHQIVLHLPYPIKG